MFQSFHLQGIQAFQQGNYPHAKSLFIQAIESNAEEAESQLFLGKSYFLCDEKAKAEEHLKKYIALNQENPDALNVSNAYDVLAQCAEAQNKRNDAVHYYKMAFKINPNNASAHHNLGLMYTKQAEAYLKTHVQYCHLMFMEAQTQLKIALEAFPANPFFLHSVASWYEKYIGLLEKSASPSTLIQQNISNNYKFALEYYNKGLLTCPEDAPDLRNIIYTNLTECSAQYGHHLYQLEDYSRALEQYLNTLQHDPGHIPALTQAGMCYFKQGNYFDARRYFSIILDYSTESQEQAEAWLNIACSYRTEKNFIEADMAIEKAIHLSPQDPDIQKEKQQLIVARSQSALINSQNTLFVQAAQNNQARSAETETSLQIN